MSKKSIKDNFIISILVILMILIFTVTVYFILDVFGIITVPRKYSIASLFYSQIEVIATGGEILTEDNSKFHEKDDVVAYENKIINDDKTVENNYQEDEKTEVDYGRYFAGCAYGIPGDHSSSNRNSPRSMDQVRRRTAAADRTVSAVLRRKKI